MTDGIDHVNIYSKGTTQLGRALSNFSDHRITTLDGEFASLEGYWYWLGCTHARREELRHAVGWAAKALGRELRSPDWVHGADFKLRIVNAMVTKLILHPFIRHELQVSALPFRHYYVYGDKVVEPTEGKWIVETWEHLRRLVRSDYTKSDESS